MLDNDHCQVYKLAMLRKSPYIFDVDGLQDTLDKLDVSPADIAKVLNKTTRTLLNHRTGKTSIRMTDYLALANAVGLDPRKFLIQRSFPKAKV